MRDLILNKAIHDLDFAVNGPVSSLARMAANAVEGAFYTLDEEHQTYRVVFQIEGKRIFADFAALRAENIAGDLSKRDFTINAMAIDLATPEKIIDPLKGASDLQHKILRACSKSTFEDDPLRILRLIRLALGLNLEVEKDTLKTARMAVPLMVNVSIERQRDEFFRMLEGSKPATAIRLLDSFGIIPALLPELITLKGVQQPAPHTLDVFEHTLATLSELEILFSILIDPPATQNAQNLAHSLVVLRLGSLRQKFASHFEKEITPGRSLRGLLFLAALYHDIEKPQTKKIGQDGTIHFLEHEKLSALAAAERAKVLCFSQAEVLRVAILVKHHLRIHWLAEAGKLPSRKSIYRFFRDTGIAGVDICLLSLADTLATYGVTLPENRWINELDVCREMLSAWWERQIEVIHPVRLLTGDDLQKYFGLQPGPIIGKLLGMVQEGQASGEITTFEEALKLVNDILNTKAGREDEKDGESIL